MVNINREDSSQHKSYKKLHVSTNKVFMGVIGGFAEYLNIDATFLRLVFILFLVLTGFFPGVLIYFVAAVIMPKE